MLHEPNKIERKAIMAQSIEILNGTATWEQDDKGNTKIVMKPGQSEPRTWPLPKKYSGR